MLLLQHQAFAANVQIPGNVQLRLVLRGHQLHPLLQEQALGGGDARSIASSRCRPQLLEAPGTSSRRRAAACTCRSHATSAAATAVAAAAGSAASAVVQPQPPLSAQPPPASSRLTDSVLARLRQSRTEGAGGSGSSSRDATVDRVPVAAGTAAVAATNTAAVAATNTAAVAATNTAAAAAETAETAGTAETQQAPPLAAASGTSASRRRRKLSQPGAAALAAQPLPGRLPAAAVAAGQPAASPNAPLLDPSQLPIADRLQLLKSHVAARTRGFWHHSSSSSGGSRHGHGAADPGLSVLSCCSAAGLCTSGTCCVLEHVAHSRISPAPESLTAFLEAYNRLVSAYGRPVVLEWLRRAPPIIRCEHQVPARLAELQQLLGGADLAEALALSRRCPQVLGVEPGLLRRRLGQLCQLLGRPHDLEGPNILSAAPALLAMQPATLAAKAGSLAALAATHPRWAAALESCSAKSLAVMLTYSLERQARLQFLVEQGLQAKAGMSTTMALSRRRLGELYPGYEAWEAARVQQKRQQADTAQAEAAAAAEAAAEARQREERLLRRPGRGGYW